MTPSPMSTGTPADRGGQAGKADMSLRSSAFADSAEIPARYTCKGVNVSPQLEWTTPPEGTRSLVVFVFDPDAGPALGASIDEGFVHWLVFGLPADTDQLPEGIPKDQLAALGARLARNDFGHPVYQGPCPPARHHYIYRVIALDGAIDLSAGVAPRRVLEAIAGHVLAQADLNGVFGPAR